MRIAALEGPSFAGKTTTLSALRPLLSSMTVVAYDCYVDQITNLTAIPPARTQSGAEQMEAFRLFMRIEADRVANLDGRAGHADLVVLDRSVDTLLAHAYALDRLYGYGVHDDARAVLAQLAYLRPDHTFYLDADPETLQRRHSLTAEPFDSFLLSPEFVQHFRDYFTHSGLPISAHVSIVHTERSQSAVAQHIARILLESGGR